MLSQTFDLSDIPRTAVLAFLELLLSADNAIVLGLISSKLPLPLRSKALYIGFLSAWLFRLAAILGVALLLKYPFLQFAGGLYLLYVALNHLKNQKNNSETHNKPVGFWKTVLIIELFDLAFAVDSIVAGVAFIGSAPNHALIHPKLWIVYLGGMIGVFAIRYASHFFSAMIHKFPHLEKAAHGMIGWIGLKLIAESFSWHFPYMEGIFWTVLAIIFFMGVGCKEKSTHG